MNVAEFAEGVLVIRKSTTSFDKFRHAVTGMDLFNKLVDSINDRTTRWGKLVGILDKEDDRDKNLSTKEREWKRFFENHSFESNNEQRNIADAFSLAIGMDLTRFIVVSKQRNRDGIFAPWICIVPTRNNGGHNYPIGEPVLKFQGSSSNSFVKMDGKSGNSMDTDISSMRLAKKSEISDLVLNIFWGSSGAIESMILSLLME